MGFLFLFVADRLVAGDSWTLQRVSVNLIAAVIGNAVGHGLVWAWQSAGDEK